MGRGTSKGNTVNFGGESVMNALNLSEEHPITIYVNGTNFVTLMCTPENLKDLAAGHLINSGIVKSMKDILIIMACDQEREIYINAPNANLNGNQLKQIITTGCSSGADISEKLKELPKIHSDHKVSIDEIKLSFKRMIKESKKYIEHGGIHSSSLVNGDFFITMEDVARHNSHDKVTGYAAMRDINFTKSMIITTGRISADMVYKAVNSNIPIICSLSNPTTLAVEIAQKCNITVVGRAMRPNMTVFTHNERVVI